MTFGKPRGEMVRSIKVIDLNEARITPRDHLSVPVAHGAIAPKRQAVETVLVRSTETGVRCSLFL
jgi:hypothetical protein